VSCMTIIYSIENIRNGIDTFTSNPEVAEHFARLEGYKVTASNYIRIKGVGRI